MSSIESLIVLPLAYWAGTSAIFSGLKLLNEARDRSFIGELEGRALTKEQRRNILQLDWLPTLLALVGVSVVFGVFLLLLPSLANGPGSGMFAVLCWLTAAVPIGGTVCFLIRGFREYGFINCAIDPPPASEEEGKKV